MQVQPTLQVGSNFFRRPGFQIATLYGYLWKAILMQSLQMFERFQICKIRMLENFTLYMLQLTISDLLSTTYFWTSNVTHMTLEE